MPSGPELRRAGGRGRQTGPGGAAPEQERGGPPPGWEDLLEPGERILWQGRPNPAMAVRPGDLAESVIGAMLVLLAVWVIWAHTDGLRFLHKPGLLIWAAVSALGLAGLYLSVLKYPVEAWGRRFTHYTLTTRRGFVGKNVFGLRSLTAFPLSRDITLQRHSAGGHLWFVQVKSTRLRATGGRVHRQGFAFLPDAEMVRDLALDALRGAGRSGRA